MSLPVLMDKVKVKLKPKAPFRCTSMSHNILFSQSCSLWLSLSIHTWLSLPSPPFSLSLSLSLSLPLSLQHLINLPPPCAALFSLPLLPRCPLQFYPLMVSTSVSITTHGVFNKIAKHTHEHMLSPRKYVNCKLASQGASLRDQCVYTNNKKHDKPSAVHGILGIQTWFSSITNHTYHVNLKVWEAF